MQGLSQSVGVEKPKALVFSEFAEACKLLHKEFPNSLMIIGATPQEEREKILKEFRENPDRQILFASKALEMGVNLQCVSLVVHYDPPLTYSSYDQRCSRARRQGRADKVISVRITVKGTVEDRIWKLIEAKRLISLASMPYNEWKELLN